jgi:hypothetical protein
MATSIGRVNSTLWSWSSPWGLPLSLHRFDRSSASVFTPTKTICAFVAGSHPGAAQIIRFV